MAGVLGTFHSLATADYPNAGAYMLASILWAWLAEPGEGRCE